MEMTRDVCGADTALVLDHGSHIFIWLGAARHRAVPEPQSNGWTHDVIEAAAQGFVAGLADGRFPVPEVRVAVEVLTSSTCIAADELHVACDHVLKHHFAMHPTRRHTRSMVASGWDGPLQVLSSTEMQAHVTMLQMHEATGRFISK